MDDDTGSWRIIDTAPHPLPTDPAPDPGPSGGRGVSMVRVFGEIDLASGSVFAAGLQRALALDPDRIVVDGSAMGFCGVAGLAALMSAVAQTAARGGEVVVVGFSPLLLGLCARLWPGPQPTVCCSVTNVVLGVAGAGAAAVPVAAGHTGLSASVPA